MPKTAGALPGQEERQTTAEWRRETNNLTGRYGKIGIAAVAAARATATLARIRPTPRSSTSSITAASRWRPDPNRLCGAGS